MKLFHTSDVVIEDPDIRHGRLNADFGQGFYLSPDYEFSRRWAKRDAYINEYELDTEGLQVVRLQRDEDWFEYIFHNRRAKDTIEADVIIGPIANDTIYDTLGMISSGYLEPKEALELLLIGPEYTQVAIKSDRAKAQLHWLGAKQVQVDVAAFEARRQEELEYQQLFAKTMQRLAEDTE